MSFINLFPRTLFAIGVMGLAFSAPVSAGKDDLYVSNINSVKVDGSSVASTNSLTGGNQHLTISNPIVGVKAVSVQVTWGIAAGSSPRTTTFPKNAVAFTGSTSNGTSVGTINISPATCDFGNDGATCTSTVSFTTPNITDSTIQVKLDPTNTGTGKSALQAKNLFINLSVIQQVAKKDTALTASDPQCFLYNAGDVDLKATLTELVSGDPIAGRIVDFSVDSNPIGYSDPTDSNGMAVLNYNIDGMSAGDHNLYGEFIGDNSYNGSNDSATLGISYNFVGFQQPINADGTSIFGGRVIPIKIKLTDGKLQPVTDAAPTVWVTQVSPSTALGSDLEAATSVSAADTDNIMRYDASSNQYIYNWDASSLTNGTWYVIVELGDSDACSKGPYYATITVNKKKGK